MTEWTHRNLDLSKAQVGDVIKDQDGVGYITNIRQVGGDKNGRLIRPEYRISVKTYHHHFEDKDMPGAGYSFPIYRDGTPFNDKWAQRIKELKADPTHIDRGIEEYSNTWSDPAVIRCQCGAEVELNMVMTNTCNRCHRDYNLSGQLLAPRSQWGWDTGESLGEILASDWDINSPGPGHEGYDSLGEDW